MLDGGLATALEERGHTLDTDLWSARLLVDAPGEIAAVHRAYLRAGADCVETASYQASFPGFAALGLDDREAEALLLSSVRLATEARDAFWADEADRSERLRPLVAASVGPYGAFLADGSEYDGRYGVPRGVLRDFHARRFETLAGSGADLLACETIPSAAEAEVLLDLLDAHPGTWAWLSFSCRNDRDLADGTPLREVAGACAGHDRVAAVGVNCTSPRFVEGLLARAAEACDLPLVAYPNSGESYDAGRKRWSGRRAARDWTGEVEGWMAEGARVLGGCCRVGPAEIERLRARALACGPARARGR